ncbi:endonuclease MutS2 [Persephonella atlantica]|uniref:Endonuclease MutS2 n=1 Tax=Persephonella atlantica TaxID=2699429 RepID=A0ABS1GG41_9AQUI|nr:endonuclease MutS2 [Persephonella atlantica]MBK3331891.1 endonuclease MutS2 [Persephonella atlantica]
MERFDLYTLEYNRFLEEIAELTPNGKTKEKLLSLKPSTDREEIKNKIEKTQQFLELLKEEGYLPISEYPDISESINILQIEESVLSTKDIWDIKTVLNISRHIKQFLQPHIKKREHLFPMYKNLYSSREIERIIDESIDSSGMVKDSASKDLADVRKSIKEVERTIISTLEKIIHSQKYSDIIQEKLITVRRDRYVIPVKYNFSGKIKGIIQDRSSSGQTVYLEPVSVVELNNRLSDLKLREQLEIRKVLKFLSDILRSKKNLIRKTFEEIINIDCLYTIGKYAVRFECIFPEISEDIELLDAKHPLFLLMGKDFHPIDIKIGNIKKGLVITGPNAGGKTVALKTAGIISALFQSGVPVPVSEGSKITLFDGIFADIGDMQSIEHNLSTFTAHIKNIDRILKNLTDRTLVLLDELIPGTDPDEGSALGIGILQKIKEIGSFVMVTTHFKQIKLFALTDDYFNVCSVGFDKNTLSPTYTLHYNSVGESMAFYIVEKLGFDSSVISISRKYVDREFAKLEEAIKTLEMYKSEYEKKLKELKKQNEELKKQKLQYEKLLSELKEQKKKGWESVQKEAEEYLRSIRQEGYRILQQIRNSHSGRPLEQFLREEKGKLSIGLEEEEIEGINAGESVKLKGKNTVGEVISVRENKAHVNFGGIKVWVKLSELEKAEKKPTEKKVSFSFKRKGGHIFKPEIKLIGKTKEEAIKELEQFMDRAVLEGFTTVRIIHGFGSGVLRKAVREYLDSLPYKIRYEDAPYQEGGMGVTVVHIK